MRKLLMFTNGLTTHVIRCAHCTRALRVGVGWPKPTKDRRSRLCAAGRTAARGLAKEIARELKAR